ncbi:MAG: RagB/SusD family nutrient uptake outer membrane protein, partial [Muribaculaceae bacterium]|nr:RagB/SusD family nutrient uptake outer membrane protein [Muribaculaceae bacterium]
VPANTPGVCSVIWVGRRCRRCELIMDNDFRYWDLIRWHWLDKLDQTKNPNILLGANITGSPVQISNTNGYLNGNRNWHGLLREFKPQYYSYPIPSGQQTYNPNIGQNFGWTE